jgi:hypothetical protein
MRRAAVLVVFLVACIRVASAQSGVNFKAVAPQPCVTAAAELVTQMDSAYVKPGDAFAFRITADVAATKALPAIPADTPGYGVVAVSQHAQRQGKPGVLLLESRFIQLSDGTHVPATIDRTYTDETTRGATANAPGFLGMIPFASYALTAYGYIHHGKDATIPKGTKFYVIVGDDVATGACRAPTAAPTRPPAAGPTPEATPPEIPPSAAPSPEPS